MDTSGVRDGLTGRLFGGLARHGRLGVQEESDMLKTVDFIDEGIVERLVEETSHDRDAVMVERNGEPAVVVVSAAAYEALTEAKRQQDWAKILAYAETEPFGDLSSEERNAWIDGAVDAVRQEMYREGLHR